MAFRRRFKIDYSPGDRDNAAATRISGILQAEGELEDFMDYGLKHLEQDPYWSSRISINGLSMCLNDIRLKIQRDHMARIQQRQEKCSPAVVIARDFWSRVVSPGLHGCARCNNIGSLEYFSNGYRYAGLCSCKGKSESIPHYDDICVDARPWHNADFIFILHNKKEFVDGEVMFQSIGKELCDLYRARGGVYHGHGMKTTTAEAAAHDVAEKLERMVTT